MKKLGEKGLNGKFKIVLNRSFNNIPDALEVLHTLNEVVGDDEGNPFVLSDFEKSDYEK